MEDYVSREGLSEGEDVINMPLVDSSDPTCFEEATRSSKWRQAMEAEITVIANNQTWKLVELPKARLVAKGYSQEHGIDYNEVFAPIARMDMSECVYVDDLIYTGNDELMMNDFKKSMQKEFDMTNLGKMRLVLGIEVMQCSDGIYICQKKYTLDILRRFGMEESNPVCNPIVPGHKLCRDERGVKVNETQFEQMVGSLMYITTT
ncbi:hypothetical protein L6164_008583 [Bauhinia variegata]|uniref:Uncharacterized protein n=1 Tax=Bauhinia variegata TaxID=167791 RepID=A0ACB9PH76_BAUVA|nr:hypothetical protein L6164_008583 [Bauhinia variegata]